MNSKYAAACLALISASILSSCSGASKGDESDTDSIATVLPSRTPEVKVVELQPQQFTHEVMSNGKMAAHDFADLQWTTADAVIDKIYVKNGDRVRAGQPIASLDRFKLENQLRQNRNDLAKARLELSDVLIGQGYDPEKPQEVPEEVMKLARLRSGLDQAETVLEATQRSLNESTLTAPFAGVVANLFQRAHNRPSASEPLCRIISDAAMDVEFSVLESELAVVSPGQEVRVQSFSAPDEFEGAVTEINPLVGEDGLVKVRARVNRPTGLFDGMNVKVSVHRALGSQLVVPKSAVVLRTGKQVVFTEQGGIAMWNYVTTGLENMNDIVITDGLTPGQRVIYDGNMNLAHESPVKVID